MLKFHETKESPFICELVPIEDLIKDTKYKMFRTDNKEWVRKNISKMLEKRIKEIEMKTKGIKLTSEDIKE